MKAKRTALAAALLTALAGALYAADVKISELVAKPTPAAGDLIPIVDVSDTTQASTGTTKSVTVGALKSVVTAGLLQANGSGAALTGITAGQVGAATTAQVSAAVAGVTPSSLGLTVGTATQAYSPALGLLSGADVKAPIAAVSPGVFDVGAYGAVGDGATDDTTAVQAAVNAASTAGGGVVRFGPKTYRLATTANGIAVPAGTTVQGSALGKTTINLDAATGSYVGLFTVSSNGVSFRDFTVRRVANMVGVAVYVGASAGTSFRGVTFDGQIATYANNFHAIKYGNDGGTAVAVTDLRVDDCEFMALNFGVFMTNASSANVSRVRVTNSRFHHNTGDDANFNAPTTGGGGGSVAAVVVANNHFHDGASTNPVGGFPVDAANAQGVSVTGNVFEGSPYNAVHVEDHSSGVSIVGNRFFNCARLDQSVTQLITGCKGITVQGNTFDQSGFNTTGQTRQSIACVYAGPGGGSNPDDVVIQGNSFRLGALFNGISAFGVSHVTVTGNAFTGSGSVASGTYTGGTNFAADMSNASPSLFSANIVRGVGTAFQGALTGSNASMGGAVLGNTITDCSLGIAAMNGQSIHVANNVMLNSVYPLCAGSNLASASTNVVVVNNTALGCAHSLGAWPANASAGDIITSSGGSYYQAGNVDGTPPTGVNGFPRP